MKNYKDVAEEYFNENWWCSKLEQNYVLSLPFPTMQQPKRAAKYPWENHRLCGRTLFSFPVLRSALLWGCLLIFRQPAKKSWGKSTEIRITLQDVWCQAGLSRCWDYSWERLFKGRECMTRTSILRWILNQSQIHPAFLPDDGTQWCQQIFTWQWWEDAKKWTFPRGFKEEDLQEFNKAGFSLFK